MPAPVLTMGERTWLKSGAAQFAAPRQIRYRTGCTRDHSPTPMQSSGVMTEDQGQLFARLQQRIASGLPHRLGVRLHSLGNGTLVTRLEIGPEHLAANGYLHAGTVVTLADTACGFGCIASLPAEATNFTTVELKSNFLRTATAGTLVGTASLVHAGRSTQVWDAAVHVLLPGAERGENEGEKRLLALFRCTQMILY